LRVGIEAGRRSRYRHGNSFSPQRRK